MAGTTSRRVLVTGSAGRIGSEFVERTAPNYHFRMADRAVDDLPTLSGEEHERVSFDITDPEACRAACEGVDTVVHLAADPSPTADFHESLLSTNIVGTYNIFRAAASAGCRRVVTASSAQAVEGYPVDVQVRPTMPVQPANLYGVSKCFGEAIASYFATQENMSAVAARIGAFEHPEDHKSLTVRDLSAFISPRDCCHLLQRCIEASGIDFAIAHGVSDNRFKRLDITSTREQVNYQPDDDAFDLFDVPLQEYAHV